MYRLFLDFKSLAQISEGGLPPSFQFAGSLEVKS